MDTIKVYPNKKAYDLSTRSKSSPQEVFLRKGVLKIRSKFTGEYPCRSVISIKLISINFNKITLWHGCSPVIFLHIFRTPCPKNTSGGGRRYTSINSIQILQVPLVWLSLLKILIAFHNVHFYGKKPPPQVFV